MFDVGFSEILLILVIALIVVGPERLPKLARTAGLWIGKARSIVSSVKAEVEREIRVEELKRSIQEQVPTQELKKLTNEVQSINTEVGSFGKELESSINTGNTGLAADDRLPKTAEAATTTLPSASSAPEGVSANAKSSSPTKKSDETTSSSNAASNE